MKAAAFASRSHCSPRAASNTPRAETRTMLVQSGSEPTLAVLGGGSAAGSLGGAGVGGVSVRRTQVTGKVRGRGAGAGSAVVGGAAAVAGGAVAVAGGAAAAGGEAATGAAGRAGGCREGAGLAAGRA